MVPRGGQRSVSDMPGLGDGLRKSYSYEPLASQDNWSPDGESSRHEGGVSLRPRQLSMSPTKRFSPPSSPESEEENKSDPMTSNFTIGNLDKDDIFTDNSPSGKYSLNSLDKGKGKTVATYDSDDESKKQVAVISNPSTSSDPQKIYSPAACIFVANLIQSASDGDLEAHVTKVFSQFGTVFVKIRRDSRYMPFAFCQYTRIEDAEVAFTHGKGLSILDRPCRTERAKANCSFIIFKKNRASITQDEVLEATSVYGSIAKVERLDETTRIAHRLPQAVVIHFQSFDSDRDIVKALKSHKMYRAAVYSPKQESASNSSKKLGYVDPKVDLIQYDIDRRSAYFGNLPNDMSEAELEEFASTYGEVLSVKIMRKAISVGHLAYTTFGFVEFRLPGSVDDIVKHHDNFKIRGSIVKINRKESRTFMSPRRRLFGNSPNAGAARNPGVQSGHRGPLRHARQGSYPVANPVPETPSPSGPRQGRFANFGSTQSAREARFSYQARGRSESYGSAAQTRVEQQIAGPTFNEIGTGHTTKTASPLGQPTQNQHNGTQMSSHTEANEEGDGGADTPRASLLNPYSTIWNNSNSAWSGYMPYPEALPSVPSMPGMHSLPTMPGMTYYPPSPHQLAGQLQNFMTQGPMTPAPGTVVYGAFMGNPSYQTGQVANPFGNLSLVGPFAGSQPAHFVSAGPTHASHQSGGSGSGSFGPGDRGSGDKTPTKDTYRKRSKSQRKSREEEHKERLAREEKKSFMESSSWRPDAP